MVNRASVTAPIGLTEITRRFPARIRYFNGSAPEPSAPVTHLDLGGVDVADTPLTPMPPHKTLVPAHLRNGHHRICGSACRPELPDPQGLGENALMAGALTFTGGVAAQALGYDGVTAAHAAANEVLNNRQPHWDERKLAARLAAASGGKYTQAEIEDAMRVLGNRDKDETVATGMVVKAANWQKEIYDNSARWVPGADGQSLVQVLPQVGPEVIAYVQEQTGGWASPYAPPVYVLPSLPAQPGQPRDRLTGLPLDERGRYTTQVVIEGKVYQPKYWPCATAECLARNANLDTTDPGTQAYLRALDKKILDDVGKGAAVIALVSPVGAVGGAAAVVGTTASFANGAIEGDLASPLLETASSAGAQSYLEHVWKLPKATAARITALIELGGGWEAFAARLNPESNPKNKGNAARGGAK